jgi:hypothetical protein
LRFSRLPILVFNLTFLAVTVVSGVIAGAFLVTSPIAFQMASSITPVEAQEPDWGPGAASLDVERFIGSIPFRSTEALYEVRPRRLYELTMARGLGNCANKSRGMSYHLLRAGIPFQRIDLIHVDAFVFGSGHTMIRTKYSYRGVTRTGLVDVLEGSLPEIDEVPIDLPELRAAAPFQIAVHPLSPRVDGSSDYYGTFLEASVISVTPMEDTERYFEFIEAVHFPIGSERVSRIVFNGLAVLADRIPRRCVSAADYERLFGSRMYIVNAAWALRVSARAVIVLLPVFMLLNAVVLVRRLRRSRRSVVGTTSVCEPTRASVASRVDSTTMT